MKFEWDEAKNINNKKKHGISFEIAALIFNDPYYVEMYDYGHNENEDRYISLGKVDEILFVVFTEHKENRRLISARITDESERRLYLGKTVFYETDGKGPTEEQLKQVREAAKKPIVFDDDCPELSPEMIKAFKCVVAQRNRLKSLTQYNNL